jgi:hypothetical protein
VGLEVSTSACRGERGCVANCKKRLKRLAGDAKKGGVGYLWRMDCRIDAEGKL